MAELIRHYLSEGEQDLRERSERAAEARRLRQEITREVEAEFPAKGNYSGADMIAEVDRRLAQRAQGPE